MPTNLQLATQEDRDVAFLALEEYAESLTEAISMPTADMTEEEIDAYKSHRDTAERLMSQLRPKTAA